MKLKLQDRINEFIRKMHAKSVISYKDGHRDLLFYKSQFCMIGHYLSFNPGNYTLKAYSVALGGSPCRSIGCDEQTLLGELHIAKEDFEL